MSMNKSDKHNLNEANKIVFNTFNKINKEKGTNDGEVYQPYHRVFHSNALTDELFTKPDTPENNNMSKYYSFEARVKRVSFRKDSETRYVPVVLFDILANKGKVYSQHIISNYCNSLAQLGRELLPGDILKFKGRVCKSGMPSVPFEYLIHDIIAPKFVSKALRKLVICKNIKYNQSANQPRYIKYYLNVPRDRVPLDPVCRIGFGISKGTASIPRRHGHRILFQKIISNHIQLKYAQRYAKWRSQFLK